MSGTAPPVAVVDTCVLVAAYNRKDEDHEAGVAALNAPRVLVVSPLVLAEVDHLLIKRAGERVALNAVTRVGALARLGHVQIAPVTGALLGEAEALLTKYAGHALGLADAVNAVLAWRLGRPALLSFDHHYTDVIAPRTRAESRLEVVPGPRR
ncbi:MULTISPECIES: type II toxin-antitoxin system VapC family toxin [unclassified Streptomyces]|uniref:type II toxin-antitoxin system VapC family toxin n=1 Tax=unclassified Streptomyces TaxID=2593676 RepID=UPI00278BE2F8|nr:MULTISPECIES: PIN domain-containing protein [unclassified Streptomyces]